jgi:hypothetical protein
MSETSGEKKKAAFHVDFGKARRTMEKGIRRAYAFLSLGMRSATDKNVESIALDSNFHIRFLPERIPPDQIAKIQNEFGIWITGNGLRELDQFFSSFLDDIYAACVLAELHGKTAKVGAIKRRLRGMHYDTNLAGKLDRLQKEFGISATHRDLLASLAQARNALAHNFGVVASRHCEGKNTLELKWIGPEVKVGERVLTHDFEEFMTEKEEALTMQFVERRKATPVGSVIVLLPHDLCEICLTFSIQMSELLEKGQKYARELGIPNEGA